jgi:hypothetical protein
VEATIMELLKAPKTSDPEISRTVDAIGTHLRVTRQIERLAQLELRIADRSRQREKLFGLMREPLAPIGTPGEFIET